MFGSASQKPGGFSFGAPSAPGLGNTASTTGTSFNFGGSNNNTSNIGNTNTAPAQSSGFSFGNNNSTGGTAQTPAFSFGKPNNTSQQANTSTGGFSFGNTGTSTNSTGLAGGSTGASKPSLFGNSATNPSFSSSAVLGFGQSNFPQTQNQNNNQSSYGANMEKLSGMPMPKALTSALTKDVERPKRKRASSTSSQIEKKEPVSLVGKLIGSFGEPICGFFSPSKKPQNLGIQNDYQRNSLNEQIQNYSANLGLNIPATPAAKSEFRRLIIKNPRDAFNDFEKIDANAVMLAKREDESLKTYKNIKGAVADNEKVVISTLKPPSKRQKKNQNSIFDEDLTFSKPLTEQLISNDNKLLAEPKQEKIASEYWCTPSIAELSKLTSLELTHVENFTAGRKGVGHLMYKYPVDISAFEGKWDTLLGQTIVFEKKVLQVYPDENKKPSQGNGLNVPAVITLQNVFPKNFDPLNPDAEILETHIEKLKAHYGMNFISFDPLNGNYVFEVEHFSIWGIVDEEEDDPELVAKWQKQQQQELQNEKRRNEMQINSLEKIAGYGQPGDNWKRQKPDLGAIAPGAFIFTNNEEEEEDEDNDENLAGKNLLLVDKKDEDGMVDASVPSGLSADENDNKLVLLKDAVNDIDELVEVRAYEPEVKDVNMQFLSARTELSISDNWDEQLAMSNGFFSVFNRNLNNKNDVNLDSKTVGDLIFAGTDTTQLKKAIVEPPLVFEHSDQYFQCMRNEIKTAVFCKRPNLLPRVETANEVSLNIPLKSFENTSAYNIWELLAILYDFEFLQSFLSSAAFDVCDHDITSPKFKHIVDIKRRELLCDFLLKISVAEDLVPIMHDSTEKIYHFLCVGNLGDAIQYAINTKNHHMAVLLTMLDSNDAMVHELARGQLEEWNQGTLNFIPSGVLKVYKLLSGDILSKKYIDHLEGLSWPVILYLLVKYGDVNKPLVVTVRDFVSYFETSGMLDETLNQIYFLIMKLYSINSNNNGDISMENEALLKKFDVELQFLIMRHLASKLKVNDNFFDNVVIDFSRKLERKGYVEESIYALENLVDDNRAASLIRKTLNENVENLCLKNANRFQAMQQDLKLDSAVLHEALAFEYRRTGNYNQSLAELLAADNLSEAHSLFLEHVAPDFIIANKAEDLTKLNDLVSEFGTLSESKVGAGVYGDYVQVIRLTENLDADAVDYSERCEKLVSAVDGVLNGLASLDNKNAKVKIAKTLIMKNLIGVVFRENLSVSPDTLKLLDLPESERNYLEAKLNDAKIMITN